MRSVLTKLAPLTTAAAVVAAVAAGHFLLPAAHHAAARGTGPASYGAPPPTAKQPAPNEGQFVAVSPCRIVDSRPGSPLTSTSVHTYFGAGGTGFAPQGGKSGGCGVPLGATAISVAATSTGASNAGYMRFYPVGEAEPAATLLNYQKAVSVGTGAVVRLSADGKFKAKNYGGPTDLVVDLTGYYVKPLSALIDVSGNPYSGSSRVTAATRTATGVYSVTFDRNVANCSVAATTWNTDDIADANAYSQSDPATVLVHLSDNAGAAINGPFYITVTC